MKIACSTMVAPGATFREKLSNLQRYGFEGVEVRLLETEATPQRLAELEEALAESPLGVGAVIMPGSSYTIPLDSEEAKRAKLACAKKGLELGARVRAGTFITPEYRPQPLSLWYPPAKLTAEERELFYSFLAEVVEYAEKISAVGLLEPINRYETHFYHCIAEVMEVIEAIGSERLRIVVDFFHMNIEEADIASSIESAAECLDDPRANLAPDVVVGVVEHSLRNGHDNGQFGGVDIPVLPGEFAGLFQPSIAGNEICRD